jgi:hypothetical protein
MHQGGGGGGGGIHRLKEHLVGVRGQVKSCEAPLDVIGPIREEMQKVLNDYQEEKAREKAIQAEIGRKRVVAQMRAANPTFDYEDSPSIHSTGVRNRDPFHYVPPPLESENTMHPPKSKKRNTIQRYFTPPPTSGSDNANVSQVQPTQFQPTLDDHWKKQYREIAYEYIARWWYHVDIPFNVARSPYYQPMWDAIIACGRGFKGPSMHDLRGSLLHKEVASIEEYLTDFKVSWAKTGCTIMSDGWSDGRNRTIINFLVSCPQGTMFLRSVDASDRVKDANLLFELLDEVVMEVGVANVVQVITDNASNYVLAGKMLEEKHKTIFWTPCVAHCIDLMLEDIGKQEWIKNTIEHAKSITKYIYNHSWVLSLMRKNTENRELLRPAITRFATHFLTLQSMASQSNNLQKMFASDEWNASQWARRQDGKDTKKKVNDPTFWKKAAEIVKIVEPLVKVLRLVDGEKLAMGYIYEAMDQAKEQIRATYKDRVTKYGPIWEIIDRRWNNQLHRPIHAAGYFLNPRYHYRAQLGEDMTGEVRDGLYDCLERMVPSESEQLEIHRQITSFTRATGTFGKNLAKIARDVDEPGNNSKV